ncbi:UNC93-like protein MFSD11 [Lycorma delicatula]|uniref:UNC93-like protein MFSD11 n=1 Tax=Lycorma delicatula TaxID=130591 RepID=UPI003F511BD1
MHLQSRSFNTIYLGICFMVLFTSFLTMENLQKTIMNSIKDESPEFEGDGYFSLTLLYASFSGCLWLAPSVISIFGPAKTMLISTLGYTIYIAAFYIEKPWAIYLGGIIEGGSAALLWTAQGNYIILNSDPDTIIRNSGIFWIFFQSSSLYGNSFVYFAFANKTHIDKPTRIIVTTVLLGISLLSFIMFFWLRSPGKDTKFAKEENNEGPVAAFKRAWVIFTDKKMFILSITFCYTGLQGMYVMGMYSSCLGFTLQFGPIAKQLVALSGLFIGVGEIFGGFLQFSLAGVLNKLSWGRSLGLGTGIGVQILGYLLMIINLPNNSVFGDTYDKAIIESNIAIGLLCSCFLGIGDSCFNTQIIALLATMFPGESSKSIALYKFTKCLFTAAGFFMSNYLGLQAQATVMCILGVMGIITYCSIDRIVSKKEIIKQEQVKRQADEKIEPNHNKDTISTIT